MHIIEQHLQSKQSAVPDHGGEDALVITPDLIAVIDGSTAKTKTLYDWHGEQLTPGRLAKNILTQAVMSLDPDLPALDACRFLDQQIYAYYVQHGIVDIVRKDATQRATAVMVLYNHKRGYVMLAGDCHAVIDGHYYQNHMAIDAAHAEARSNELHRLITTGELTIAQLLQMSPDQDPGRAIILNPPEGATYPGLFNQGLHQNNPHSPYGFLVLDGFAHFDAPGFSAIAVPASAKHIVLASDGYPVDNAPHPAEILGTLQAAEDYLAAILHNDPMLFQLYKSTKGKGTNVSFDDRSYIRIALSD